MFVDMSYICWFNRKRCRKKYFLFICCGSMCNLVFNSDYIVTYYVQQLDCNCMILIKNNLDTTRLCCFCYIYRFLTTSKVKYTSGNFYCFPTQSYYTYYKLEFFIDAFIFIFVFITILTHIIIFFD